MVTGLHRQRAVAANPVAAFAHGADHVIHRGFTCALRQRDNLVKRLVHGRTRQVVHGGVNDAKVFLLAGFQVKHFGQAHTGIAHQRTPGLNHQAALAKTALIQAGQQLRPQRIGRRWRVAVVIDAQAAAKVEVGDGHTRGFDGLHQVQHFVEGVEVRPCTGDL